MVNLTHDSTISVMTDFPIVNFQYLRSNIQESPAYGIFVKICNICCVVYDYSSRYLGS